MNTHPTPRIAQVIGASGECTEAVFREAPDVMALSDKQIDRAVNAWFNTEDTHHEPSFRQRMRAAIAATGEAS